MIKINYQYTILFTSTVGGVGTAADSTPTAVLWRNGSASGVSVTVSTTAQTGLYKAVFTTDAGWSGDDFLELYVTATITGTAGYLGKVWSSTEVGAAVLDTATQVQVNEIKAKTDNLPADPADQSAVEAAITSATSGLATAANQVIIIDGIGWTLASLYGACANPQAANALVQLTINGYAYSGQYAGLTSTGVRTAPTLTKV